MIFSSALALFTLRLAATAIGFTFVMRSLSPRSFLLHKPLSCALCLAWWPSFTLGNSAFLAESDGWIGFFYQAPEIAMVVFGATGLAYLGNKTIELIAFHID